MVLLALERAKVGGFKPVAGPGIRISNQSVEYLRCTVAASLDPTSDAVEFQFPAVGDGLQAANWEAGAWVAGAHPYTAQILIGAGGVVLTAGVYEVWVRITDAPEVPVLYAGRLEVTDDLYVAP